MSRPRATSGPRDLEPLARSWATTCSEQRHSLTSRPKVTPAAPGLPHMGGQLALIASDAVFAAVLSQATNRE